MCATAGMQEVEQRRSSCRSAIMSNYSQRIRTVGAIMSVTTYQPPPHNPFAPHTTAELKYQVVQLSIRKTLC